MLIRQTGTYGDPPAMVTIPAPNIINTYTGNIYCISKLIYNRLNFFKKIDQFL